MAKKGLFVTVKYYAQYIFLHYPNNFSRGVP